MGTTKRIGIGLFSSMAVGGAAFVLFPSPLEPVAFEPPPRPALEGPYLPNEELTAATRLGEDVIEGGEGVAVDAGGAVYTGTADGRIVRVAPDGTTTVVANTGGRPLGMVFDPHGTLLVADAVRGVLAVRDSGSVEILTPSDGRPELHFTDDLAVGADGTVYFSDASTYGIGDHLKDLIDGRPHGRLLRHAPGGMPEVLADELYFANGVALAADESFVLVAETYRFRLRRVWLRGPKAGQTDLFADNLPGFPDNVRRSPRGTFWVAMFTIRSAKTDFLSQRPFLRAQIAKLPRSLWPDPDPYGFVVELDAEGRPLRSLHDPDGDGLHPVTTAVEHDGMLYLGSLHGRGIARLALNAPPPTLSAQP